MMRLADIARWSGGRLLGDDIAITGVSTDTRSLRPGELFVALRGPNHDGARFAADAVARGAVAVLAESALDVDVPRIIVADALQALAAAAAGYRAGHPATVVGITGSNGKTTVRMLLAGILAGHGRTHATEGNFNNEIGLPLSVLAMPADAQYAVLEMGAGQPGDIEALARIARPQVGVVTNVSAAHLARMGSLEGVALTKGALYDLLPTDGCAVINADDAFASRFRDHAGARRVLTFGLRADADVRGVGSDAGLRLLTPQGEVTVELALRGRHNHMNALAATAAALALDVPLQSIADGLARARPLAGRLSTHHHDSGATVIDDSYNANPGSFAAAIAVLAGESGRRVLVMGDMGELGSDEVALHAAVGERAAAAGIDRLLACGALSRHAVASFGAGGSHHASQAALLDALQGELHPGVTILVKGSRAAAMEKIVQSLLDGPAAAGGGGHAA